MVANFIKNIASWYFSRQALPYWCVLLFDCAVVVLSGFFCVALDRGVTFTADNFVSILYTLLIYLLFFLAGFRMMRTYSGVLRYSSFADVYRVGLANLFGIICIFIARSFLNFDKVFLPIPMKELFFTSMFMAPDRWPSANSSAVRTSRSCTSGSCINSANA